MLFSCCLVRLPGPDSSLKMLLSSKHFCGGDGKNLAIWTGYGVWGSSACCHPPSMFRLSSNYPVKDMLHLERIGSFPWDGQGQLQLWSY